MKRSAPPSLPFLLLLLLPLAAPPCAAGEEGAPASPCGPAASRLPGWCGPQPAVELRAGALLHDRTLAMGRRREPGWDGSLELLFRLPDGAAARAFFSPRLQAGGSANLHGGTSMAYAGLSWRLLDTGRFFLDGAGGLALHDGRLEGSRPDRESLGSRVLFRTSAEAGARIRGGDGLSLLLEHVSNARLAYPNAGITNLGVRWFHRF